MEAVMAKASEKAMKCYWCSEDVGVKGFHHETYGRTCCKTCYLSPQSNFRKAYGPANVTAVADEVKRARGE